MTNLVVTAHGAIAITLSLHFITRRRHEGVSLAWLIPVFILPFAGAMLYVILGGQRLGRRRAERVALLSSRYEEWLRKLPQGTVFDWSDSSLKCKPIIRFVDASLGIPSTAGNRLVLLDEAELILRSIIADIDGAKHTCYIEFYKLKNGGTADEVCEAVIRACRRGVACRILLDAVGSARFLKSGLARHLQENGVRLIAALPIGLSKPHFLRLDFRLHRKIVVIDCQVAYTGSINLVDPRYFKQNAGVGQWVDSMVRIEGPAVRALGSIFLWDWEIETGENVQVLKNTCDLKTAPNQGTAIVQVIPSGPGYGSGNIHRSLLACINTARSELVITTPYFIPDKLVLSALRSAAARGVSVTIIVPEKVDSRLVTCASRSYFETLLTSGVQILRYQGGLLHTKSVTVDGQIALFGTANLDIRSFWLNFEIAVLVCDPYFVAGLRDLQNRYSEKSEPVALPTWRRRPGRAQHIEHAARLFAPFL